MRKTRVVIVEDEWLIAKDIADRLNRDGYSVAAIFHSAEEALSDLANSSPDIVLMDIQLKGKMSGIDAASQVRAKHNIPVIFLTAHADGETVAIARRADPYGLLPKPSRLADLANAIKMALHKHCGNELIESLSELDGVRRMGAILKAANASADIAEPLLTLSRSQLLETELLDVNDHISRTAHLVEPSFGPRCKLTFDLAEDTGKVCMNPGQLTKLAINLLLNALDHMPNGGSILVSTSNIDIASESTPPAKAKRYVRIMVTDSGEGIKPEVQEHIFDPFLPAKGGGAGSGMGLALVYGIVKDTGGEITVRNTPGLGACFDVLLPRAEEEFRLVPALFKQPEPQHDESKTILLVEDQDAIRKLIQVFFEKKGFRLITAENGREALARAESYEGRIDVLISDVLMPHMDGPTLATKLNQIRPGVKILFISGHPGDSIDAIRNFTMRSEFLQKPFKMPTLLSKIEALTAR